MREGDYGGLVGDGTGRPEPHLHAELAPLHAAHEVSNGARRPQREPSGCGARQ